MPQQNRKVHGKKSKKTMAKLKNPRQIKKAMAKRKSCGKIKKLQQNKNCCGKTKKATAKKNVAKKATKIKIWRQNRKARADTVFRILSENIL